MQWILKKKQIMLNTLILVYFPSYFYTKYTKIIMVDSPLLVRSNFDEVVLYIIAEK